MNMIRLQLIYPEEKVKEPVLCMVCKNFDVVVNIRTAKVSRDTGMITVKFIEEQGVIVQPIEGQIFTE